MQGNLTLRSFGLLCIAVALGSFGQVFLKMGLHDRTLADPHSIVHTVLNIVTAMLNPWVLLGLAIYVISTFFWLMVISQVRLSVAYPLISMSYPVVVALSGPMLGEHVKALWAVGGLVFISAGVSFIGLGLGKSPKEAKQCKD